LRDVYNTGSAVKETSYYSAFESMANAYGKELKPRVRCVINLKNKGAGIPDAGFFTSAQFQRGEEKPRDGQLPERGCAEIKSTKDAVEKIAKSEQVEKYLNHYGAVLVTNYRDFLLIGKDANGNAEHLERFSFAETETEFWKEVRADASAFAAKFELSFDEFIKRVFLHAVPLTKPEDVAWFLASYAREAKERVERAKDLSALQSLRKTMEEALGITFRGEEGERFFRSTLIQTLFYGVFSAWVLWSKKNPGNTNFDWRTAVYELKVPMIRALYYQVAEPTKLENLGLVELLDQTNKVLNRIIKQEFFQKFSESHAVQYFYEPFLENFDNELRKQLGVWYTPEEIVRYMVARVDTVLKEELNLPDGLADENVYILDPCCGTGAYLVEVLKHIAQTLKERGDDATIGATLREAVTKRIFGFEILPAPFVVAHLQIGLFLQTLGTELKDERAAIYLTNALTGWEPPKDPKARLLFPEMQEERDRADEIKQKKKIIVILGNPPYNGYASVAMEEERDLSDAYRTTKRAPAPQGQGLNDLYVRFYRMAERRIAEISKQGVICYISNYSWLEGLSHTGMRERFIEEFDDIWIDNLNGDKYKTGKVTPDGKPDPSAFSTTFNREGIQVGTAVATFVRKLEHQESSVKYREFWGKNKLQDLLNAADETNLPHYESVAPNLALGFPLIPTNSSEDYFTWALLPELFPVSFPGVKTSRDEFLVSTDKESLLKRMETYFDSNVSNDEMKVIAPSVMRDTERFKAQITREYLLKRGFKSENLVRYSYRPFDIRWLYWEAETKLLDEKRAELFPQVFEGNFFINASQQNRRNFDPPMFTNNLGSLHLIERSGNLFPLYLKQQKQNLFDDGETIAPNLSELAANYLKDVSADAPDLFFHALAILHSTAYRTEHASALRQNFPRIPLPAKLEDLRASANLGKSIAALLDTETPVANVTAGKLDAPFASIGALAHAEGLQLQAEDFEITAGWGHAGKGGVTMPAKGKLVERDYTEAETNALTLTAERLGLSLEDIKKTLGATTFDIYLNNSAYWRNIPRSVWEYTIGGYQVIKKWLSYRETELLGRALTLAEANEVRDTARRIAAILLTSGELDKNYLAAKATNAVTIKAEE
jgi:hypothetical protein